jgi:hypothetical protein
MRSRLLRILVGTVLFSLPPSLNSFPEDIKTLQTVWFAASQSDNGELYLDPVAKKDGDHLVLVPNGCTPDDPAFKKFVAEIHTSGRPYDISFRGRYVGSAVFKEGNGEMRAVPIGNSNLRKPIPNGLSGLASSERIPRSRTDHSRAVTPDEEAAAKQIATESFKTAGVPVSLLSKITVDRLEQTYLLPSKQPSLIGSFLIDVSEQDGLIHSLFLIATKKGSEYHADLVWSKISRGETDNEKMQLVDYADMFGDGQDEVVVDLWYYENYSYRIYRRQRDGSKWEQVFETEILGCE